MNTVTFSAAGSAPAADSVLVHMCCGPCSIMPITRLREEGFVPTGFFYNPNIHPLMEYLRRREGVVTTSARLEIPVIYHDETDQSAAWNVRSWISGAVHTEAGARAAGLSPDAVRCAYCYRDRLRLTARKAKALGFSGFTTSLLYSRMQRHDHLRQEGLRAAQEYGIAFVYRDFRDGWQEGIDTSKDWGIYRQNYCGCVYSEAERFAKKLQAFALS